MPESFLGNRMKLAKLKVKGRTCTTYKVDTSQNNPWKAYECLSEVFFLIILFTELPNRVFCL